jgi:hypothetical protein
MSKPDTNNPQTSEPKKNAELAKDFHAAFKNFDKDGSGNDSKFQNNLFLKDYRNALYLGLGTKSVF